MKKVAENEVNESLIVFLDHINYDVKYLRGPSEKDQSKAVETLESLGFEIFPEVIITGKNEHTIYYRKKRA